MKKLILIAVAGLALCVSFGLFAKSTQSNVFKSAIVNNDNATAYFSSKSGSDFKNANMPQQVNSGATSNQFQVSIPAHGFKNEALYYLNSTGTSGCVFFFNGGNHNLPLQIKPQSYGSNANCSLSNGNLVV